MTGLVRFLLCHALAGVMLGAAFVAYLILADVGGLGTLILASPDRVLVIGLLLAGMSVTFGSAQMGIAIMLLASKDGDDTGRRLKLPAVPMPARAATARPGGSRPRG